MKKNKLFILVSIIFIAVSACSKQVEDNSSSSDSISPGITQVAADIPSSMNTTTEPTPSTIPMVTRTIEPTTSPILIPSLIPTQVPLFLEATYTLNFLEIMDWFTLDKVSILNLFGDNYSITTSLYQKETDLYSYGNGLRFAFDADQKLSFMECADTVVLSDKHGDMSFKQLMYLNTPTDIMCFQSDGISYYYIEYSKLDESYRYISKEDPTGANCDLLIYSSEANKSNSDSLVWKQGTPASDELQVVFPDEAYEPFEIDTIAIEQYFELNREELIQVLGDEFIIRRTGAEQESIGIEYPSGLCFVFSDDTKYLLEILCDDTVSLNGAHGGMKFDEIIGLLGEGEYYYNKSEEAQMVTYRRTYRINGNRYNFYSSNEDGEGSYLTITKDY